MIYILPCLRNINIKSHVLESEMASGLIRSNVRVFCTLLLVAGCLLQLTVCLSEFSGIRSNRHSIFGKRKKSVNAMAADYVYETHYYTQTLDHFTYTPQSYETFWQRYIVVSKYWGGPQSNAPIFVYTGDEGDIEEDVAASGFFLDIAPQFKALLVYIEHRYYGETMPFGSRGRSFENSERLGYFTATQALADYATLIVDLKKNLSAQDCPVIVYGGSYGGMLAAWFRLKYPHIAIGAFASSAPILYFDDITPHDGYGRVVTEDFRKASKSCYRAIKNSWIKIDAVASEPHGLQRLSKIFKTCKVLDSASSLKNWLTHAYFEAAQYDNPPDYPVDGMCMAIDGLPKGTDILTRIYAAANFLYNISAKGTVRCFNLEQPIESMTTLEGWRWQTCTEILIPISNTPNTTMFPLDLFNLELKTQKCKGKYGVLPRPHWITTEFGGYNIERVLRRFGSNIIFSNGLRDPYSIGSVLHTISASIVAIVTKEGAHCADIGFSSPNDPEWLKEQQSKEVQIMNEWIKQYNKDLVAS